MYCPPCAGHEGIWELEYRLKSFLISVLDLYCQIHASVSLDPLKRFYHTHWIDNCLAPRANLQVLEKL
jgi:hypothetical protein